MGEHITKYLRFWFNIGYIVGKWDIMEPMLKKMDKWRLNPVDLDERTVKTVANMGGYYVSLGERLVLRVSWVAALHAIPQFVLKVKFLDNRMNMAEHGWSRNTGSEKTELRDGEHHRHTAYLGDCPHSGGSFILRDPWRRQWLGSCPLRLEIFDVIWMVGLSIELVGHHHSSSKILRDPPLANPSYPVIRLTMG